MWVEAPKHAKTILQPGVLLAHAYRSASIFTLGGPSFLRCVSEHDPKRLILNIMVFTICVQRTGKA
jgi:hypothetical protein